MLLRSFLLIYIACMVPRYLFSMNSSSTSGATYLKKEYQDELIADDITKLPIRESIPYIRSVEGSFLSDRMKNFLFPSGPLKTFDNEEEPIFSVAFSPDGSKILVGSYYNEAKLWDIKTGKVLKVFKHQGLSVQ